MAGHDSSQPTRSWTAPVKAPFRWPNSSDSMRVGDRAERLRVWNAPPSVAVNASRSGSNGT